MIALNPISTATSDPAVLRIFLQDHELDQAIAEVGCVPTERLPIEVMRAIVADVSMAVAVAISMGDESEFAKAIGCLSPRCGQPGANFASRYLRHLIVEMAAQTYAPGLELPEVSDRFEQINDRLCGYPDSPRH